METGTGKVTAGPGAVLNFVDDAFQVGIDKVWATSPMRSIGVGMEAEVVVLDLKSTPIIHYRMRVCEDLAEALFIQMTLGDDRAVLATYVAGALAYQRPEHTSLAA
jgi:guanine deaminase